MNDLTIRRVSIQQIILGLFAIAVGLLMSSQAAWAADEVPVGQKPSKGCKVFKGLASWYGEKFHGRKTASGERFDEEGMTCAHRTLPFGTKVLVMNPASGKTCTVTVNDRGPYVGSRVIDLSKAAARKLGITGVGRVMCSTGRFIADKVTPDDKDKQTSTAQIASNN